MGDAATRHRVLIVDDEPQVRATIREALAYEGYDVTEASDGAAALAAMRDTPPDAVLLDLWMPVMDGWHFRREQLRSHPNVPVVVLSALDVSDARLKELRADAVIGKPFELDALYEAIARVISGS